LQRIRAGRACAGVNALLRIAKREPARTSSLDLGFAVGPRLNAAGRLDDMSLGIACLLTDDAAEAERIAKELDALNRERRSIEADMQDSALATLENIDPQEGYALSLFDEGWHQGVIGILASRLKDKFHRPTIAFARANNGDVAALPAIPTGSVDLVLPQQTDIWPRQVFAIVSNPEDETVPPLAIVLSQASAREQYRATHLITLEPQATLPEVPPASLGTAFLGADTPFLPVEPATVIQSYAEVLLLGEAGAPNFALFQAEGDSLRPQIGFEKKEERRAAIPSTAAIDFTNGVGDADIVTMSTLDAGALVVGYLTETETVTPTQSGATVNASGTVAALANVESSERGITATYGVQLLFYVPSLENPDDPVVLLGYTQGLIAASEVP